MWITWSVLVLVGIALIINGTRLLARDGIDGIAAPDEKWSANQIRLLKSIRVAGCIGLVILWGALVYVLVDTGGAHLTQPWKNRTQVWAVLYCLLYTSFLLSLLRTPNVGRPEAIRPSYRLAAHAFIISGMFFGAFALIVDLYLPPPAGSRPVATAPRMLLRSEMVSVASIIERRESMERDAG